MSAFGRKQTFTARVSRRKIRDRLSRFGGAMNTSRLGLLVVLLGAAGSALGHHSFRTAYDSTRSTEITGVVAEYVLKSPHSLIVRLQTNGTDLISD